MYEGWPEIIQPFWISREPVAWPWSNLAASQRRSYCASVNIHSFDKASHRPGLSAPLTDQIWHPATSGFLPKLKIAFEREDICKCDGHTIHKFSQRRLTADWLAPWESHGRVTVYGCTVRSPLTGCQVTRRPRDRFSRCSKWLDTFRTALVCEVRKCELRH